jgi:selenium metabolism protein YedF
MQRLMLQGLSCPQPVLQTKAFLDEHPESFEIVVVVDNRASAENVLRFLEHQGFEGHIKGHGDQFEVIGSRMETAPDAMDSLQTDPLRPWEQEHGKILIVVSNDKIGTGDEVLGAKLMLNFIKTLPELGDALWRLIFLNSGIKLTTKGAEALPALQQLEAQGVDILVCGTCLDHYHLLDEKRVGQTTNMLDVVMSHQLADKVINI